MSQDANAATALPPEPRPAGFWVRALAIAMDAGSVAVAGISLYQYALLAFGQPYTFSPYDTTAYDMGIAFGLAALAGLLLLPLYSAAFQASKLRATPGKLTIRAYVVDRDGRRLGFWRALVREAAKLVSLASLLIGFFMAGFTREKTALHDLIAGTRVVRLPRRAKGQPPAPAHGEAVAATAGRKGEIRKLAYVFAGIGAVPGIGWPFGVAAMIWGLLSRKAGAKHVALIAFVCGFGMSGVYALIYFAMLAPMFENIDAVAKAQLTRMSLKRVSCHLDLFKARHGRPPRTLGELYGMHYELDVMLSITDPYGPSPGGQPPLLFYEPGAGPAGYALFSVGRDGEAHTEDDILPPGAWSCPPFEPMRPAPDARGGKRDV